MNVCEASVGPDQPVAFLRKYGCEGGGFGVDYVFTFHA